MFKKLLSYFYPVIIHKEGSKLSKSLEVTMINGKLVLDSENTNYSYGSLQRILRKGLKHIGYNSIQNMNEILILGVGGGSVIQTLVDEIGYKNKIIGIEIDEQVIRLAKSYFVLHEYSNLELIQQDAFEFVLSTKKKFDLIIIDIFQDIKMPSFLFEEFFKNRLSEILTQNGKIIFNTMILSSEDQIRNQYYKKMYSQDCYKVDALKKVEHHNEVIILEKI